MNPTIWLPCLKEKMEMACICFWIRTLQILILTIESRMNIYCILGVSCGRDPIFNPKFTFRSKSFSQIATLRSFGRLYIFAVPETIMFSFLSVQAAISCSWHLAAHVQPDVHPWATHAHYPTISSSRDPPPPLFQQSQFQSVQY